MTDLFSLRDTAKIFGLQPSRLRYWIQAGLVTPAVRRGGKFMYGFADLVTVKAAVELPRAVVSVQKMRGNLRALRDALPPIASPSHRLRVCSDGETLVVLDEDTVLGPVTKPITMSFTLA